MNINMDHQEKQQDPIKIELVNKKYKICKKIGRGKFGTIYMGVNTKTNEKVAIKTDNGFPGSHLSLLKHETKILKYLNERGDVNIPLVYWFGPYNNNIVLVMPCYDYSLYDGLLNGKKYEIPDINKLCIQLVKTIEYIHNKFVIHRDIKPQNIMIKNGRVYLIDFGFSTFYINEGGEHIPNVITETITGSPKYISWNIHNGNTPSRRDDLISIGYIYILLLVGGLYWSSIGDDHKTMDVSINGEMNRKYIMAKSYENLVMYGGWGVGWGVGVGVGDNNYLKYCYGLSFNENPNYGELLGTLRD